MDKLLQGSLSLSGTEVFGESKHDLFDFSKQSIIEPARQDGQIMSTRLKPSTLRAVEALARHGQVCSPLAGMIRAVPILTQL